MKGKIIINVSLIWFEGACKIIPFKSILEFSILSYFKMRNVIIWHWFTKNLVGTWRRNDVDATSLRRIDVSTTSCACREFGPPCLPLPQYSTPCPPQYSKPSFAYDIIGDLNSLYGLELPIPSSGTGTLTCDIQRKLAIWKTANIPICWRCAWSISVKVHKIISKSMPLKRTFTEPHNMMSG